MIWTATNSTVSPVALAGGGTRDAQVVVLAAQGDSLYAVGYEENNFNKDVAKVWRMVNGAVVQTVTLSSESNNARARAILPD
jgi:hypothetical protein